jgi:TolA-binding protein
VEYIRKGQYKLLQKKLNNGYIYYKMKDYSGALIYLKEITELGNSDSLDRKALFYSTLIHLKQGNKELAAESFSNLKSKYPGSKETKKLRKKI